MISFDGPSRRLPLPGEGFSHLARVLETGQPETIHCGVRLDPGEAFEAPEAVAVFRLVNIPTALFASTPDDVKWGMNRNPNDLWSPTLATHRQGEFPHRWVLGLYEVVGRATYSRPGSATTPTPRRMPHEIRDVPQRRLEDPPPALGVHGP